MSGTLPTVRGNVQALCPITRTISFHTDVAIHADFTEERRKKAIPLTSFVLPYTRINATETAAMRAFFESQKGPFDTTWSFTLGSITYSHLTFTDDSFSMREDYDTPTLYSFTLHAKQTQNPGQASGSAGANFPTLTGGVKAQLPYTQLRRFAVLLNDGGVGQRYSYTWFAGGLTGYPTRSLRGWELAFPVLTDADLSTLETHFRNNWGQFSQFQFTDPDDAAVYPKCRYGSDVLEITHQASGVASLTLRIMETN